MRCRSTAVILAVSCFLALPALAEFLPYHELRQDPECKGYIADAIAALPTSDINGTLNRISALLERSAIQELAADAGTDGLLPENFLRGMDSAIVDLEADVQDVAALTNLDHKAYLLQVVNIVAFERNVELYQSDPHDHCWKPVGEEYEVCDSAFEVVLSLDAVASGFKGTIVGLIDWVNAHRTDGGYTAPPGADEVIDAHDLGGWVDTATTNYFYIRGVPSIED